MEMPIPNFCSWNRHGDSKSRSSEFRIPIEFQIPNFCPWNCYGNSMSRSSEFRIPIEFRIPNSEFRTSALGIAMAIPWAEVRNSEFHIPFWLFWANKSKRAMEFRIPNFCSWNCHGDFKGRSSEFGILLEFKIPNFCSWNPHGDSMSRSSESASP